MQWARAGRQARPRLNATLAEKMEEQPHYCMRCAWPTWSNGASALCVPPPHRPICAKAKGLYGGEQSHLGTAYWSVAGVASLIRRFDCLPVGDVARRKCCSRRLCESTVESGNRSPVVERSPATANCNGIWPRHGDRSNESANQAL